MDFERLSNDAQHAVQEGRLHTARRLYEQCLERFPEHTLFLGFNLGAMLQMQTGDGEGARRAYERALAGRARSEGKIRKSGLDQLEANVCENSMLLSLSYEEYESRAERLAKLDPGNPILTDQRPMVQDARERAHPWFAVMVTIAKSGYDADPAKDPGRYGASAAILQLLLRNRRELRVPREQHRAAVASYAALAIQAWSKCGMTMEHTVGVADPAEFNFVAETAIPLVEEYANANPSDAQTQETLRALKSAPAGAPRPQSPVASRSGASRASPTPPTHATPPAGCTWMPLGAVLGGLAGHFLLTRFPEAAAIGVGATLGAMATFHLGRVRARAASVGARALPKWLVTPELASACRDAGVQGLRFAFEYAVVAPDNSLALRFKPLQPIPEEKRRDAYLALRGLVAHTLPAVVSDARGVELVDAGIQYRIGIGQGGVPAPAFGLRMGNLTLGPLQTVGEIEGNAWWVALRPFSPDFEMEFTGRQKRVLRRLEPSFDRMKGELALPG